MLEFRATDAFDIRVRDKSPEGWAKAADKVREAQGRWANELPPVRRVPEKLARPS